MKFRQAKWDEPLIFERSREGSIGYSLPEPSKAIQKMLQTTLNYS